MRTEILDLSQVTDVRQTMAGRPPKIVRGTLLVLVGLLGSGVVWSSVSRVDLVVKAPVRVRPIT